MNKTTNASTAIYLAMLERLNYSADSIKSYRQGLNAFEDYMIRNYQAIDWEHQTTQSIQKYINELSFRGYQYNSVMSKLTAVRTYYKWLIQVGIMSNNPAQYVRTPRKEKKVREGATEDVIMKCLKSPVITIETKAQIACLWETGIRISELMNLDTKDIDKANQRIKIHGKGNKERWAYYGVMTRFWMNLFIKSQGRIFTRDERGIRYNIHNALYHNGGERFASPHRIRHGYATRLLNAGCDIETLSRFMGHESAVTTERYAHLNDNTLQTRAQIYH